MSRLSVFAIALLACGVPALARPIFDPSGHVSCLITSPLSCESNGNSTCCYEGVNGVFLISQYWDYVNATGPADEFTLHGLWSNKCAGGYMQYCNPEWQIESAQATLEQAGAYFLLDQMNATWPNFSGTNDDLWTHEFNKHGTCMDTLSPTCYHPQAEKHQNLIDFYSTSLRLHSTRPTLDWLATRGFAPSKDKTYSPREIARALDSLHDNRSVYLGCDANNALQEVHYFYDLRGSVADGDFVPTDAQFLSSCKENFHWYPKGYDPIKEIEKSIVTIAPSTGTGCLASNGDWSASATDCAEFTMTRGFYGIHLSTKAGSCAVTHDLRLTCDEKVKLSDLTIDNDQKIAYNGQATWSSAGSPSTSNVAVYNGAGAYVDANTDLVTYQLVARPVS